MNLAAAPWRRGTRLTLPSEEFYDVTPSSFQIARFNQALLDWERTYHTLRPPQALGYRTPQEFLTQPASQSQPT